MFFFTPFLIFSIGLVCISVGLAYYSLVCLSGNVFSRASQCNLQSYQKSNPNLFYEENIIQKEIQKKTSDIYDLCEEAKKIAIRNIEKRIQQNINDIQISLIKSLIIIYERPLGVKDRIEIAVKN